MRNIALQGRVVLFDRESKSWESLKDDDVFMLACPTYALRELEEGEGGGAGGGAEGGGGTEGVEGSGG